MNKETESKMLHERELELSSNLETLLYGHLIDVKDSLSESFETLMKLGQDKTFGLNSGTCFESYMHNVIDVLFDLASIRSDLDDDKKIYRYLLSAITKAKYRRA